MVTVKAILIVADQETNRGLLNNMLGCDYHIIEAANAQQAFSLLAGEKVDAIVLDTALRDVLEILQIKKEKKALEAIPVLVINSVKDQEQRKKILALGVGAIVYKPLEPVSLKQHLSKLLLETGIKIPENNAIIEEFCRHDSMISNMFNIFVGALALVEEQDKKLTIVRANDRFNDIFGQEKLEIEFKHKNILDAIYKADLKGLLARVNEARDSNREVPFDSRWYTSDGKVVWLHSNIRAIYRDSKKTFYLCSVEDMTVRKEEEIRNKINNRSLRMILAESKINVWEFDIVSQKFVLNRVVMRSFGFGGEVMHINDRARAEKIIHPEDEEQMDAFYAKVCAGKASFPLIIRVRPSSEEKYVWLQFKYCIIKNAAREPIRAVGVVVDVSKQKEMEAKYTQEVSYKNNDIKRYKYFYEVDLTKDRIIYTSCQEVGLRWDIEKTSFSKIILQIIQKRVLAVFQQELMHLSVSKKMLNLYKSGILEINKEYLSTDKNHRGSQWYRSRYSFAQNPANGHIMLFILVRNIHKEKLVEIKVKYDAEHDALTGAYNRIALCKVAKDRLEKLGTTKAALVIFDLDNFKDVNDRYGHQKGDEVLCTLAKTIHKVFRKGDCVCRLGGDEFAVFWEEMGTQELLGKKAKEICQIIAQKHSHLTLAPVTCSAGAAIAPQHGTTLEELYKHADEALYLTKGKGRNGYCLYGKESKEST